MPTTDDRNIFGAPSNMVTPLVEVKELGHLLASANNLADGDYDVVIEYKIGQGKMAVEPGSEVPAMAVTFSGVGLRLSDKPGPLTIAVRNAAGREATGQKAREAKSPKPSAKPSKPRKPTKNKK